MDVGHGVGEGEWGALHVSQGRCDIGPLCHRVSVS